MLGTALWVQCELRPGSGLGPGAGAESAPGRSRRHGHVPGTVVAAVAAAVCRDADVQPAARLHRVAHDPGRAAGLRALRLLPHCIRGDWERDLGTGEGLVGSGARTPYQGAGNHTKGVVGSRARGCERSTGWESGNSSRSRGQEWGWSREDRRGEQVQEDSRIPFCSLTPQPGLQQPGEPHLWEGLPGQDIP